MEITENVEAPEGKPILCDTTLAKRTTSLKQMRLVKNYTGIRTK